MAAWQTAYNNRKHDNNIDKAKKYYTTDTASLVQKYPTTSEMKTKYSMPISRSDCNGYKTAKLVDFINAGSVTPGNYIIEGDGTYVGHQITATTSPSVIILDGTQDYIFYINETVYLEGVVFAVINPNTTHHQYFILAPGKNITFNSVNSGDTNRVACGLLSLERNYTTAAAYTNAIKTMLMANCDNYYNGKVKPTIYFYAMGNNQIDVIRGTVLEAYVGQFEQNYPSTASKISFINASGTHSFKFYGRIMATNILSTSADFKIPYCPSPNVKSIEEYSEQQSKYKIFNIRYYY